jgi:hypothetical protein
MASIIISTASSKYSQTRIIWPSINYIKIIFSVKNLKHTVKMKNMY